MSRRSPFEHGMSGYRAGCRCDEVCRPANAAKARRDRARAYLRTSEAPVDATPVREHVQWLRTQGMGIRSIASDAGISVSQLRRIALGLAAKATPRTQQAILAVRPAPRYVPAGGTRARIRALAALGYPLQWVLDAMGCGDTPRGNLLSYHAAAIRRDRAAAVLDILRSVGDTPGPSRHVAAMAKTFGWQPPIAYDEDQLYDLDWDGAVESVSTEDLLVQEYHWLRQQHPSLTFTAIAQRLRVSNRVLRRALESELDGGDSAQRPFSSSEEVDEVAS